MRREPPVRFREGLGVQFPRATRRNIYVQSQAAGERVLESVTQFLEGVLRLRVTGETARWLTARNVSFSATVSSGGTLARPEDLVDDAPYFLSHATAMELHRMVTQPQFVIFVSSTKRIPKQTLHGTQFRFVLIKPKDFFGTTRHWVTKQESVEISDRERTILDGLRHPEYCGGVTDVAKGLWMRHTEMRVAKLIEYAKRLNVGSIYRRLGYLLELFGIATEAELQSLRNTLTDTYVPDPSLPNEGSHLGKWRLRLNIPPEELLVARST